MTPEENAKIVAEALRRAAKASSLGREKFAEYSRAIEMFSIKMHTHQSLHRADKVDRAEIEKLRNEIHALIDVALDAVEFVHHESAADKKWADEHLRRIGG